MGDDARIDGELQASRKKLLGRRGFLVGGLAAVGASLFGRINPAQATDDSALLVGESNFATKPTQLNLEASGAAFTATGNFIPGGTPVTETSGLVGLSGRLGVFGAAPNISGLTATSEDFGSVPSGRIGVLGSSPPTTSAEVAAPVGVFGISYGIGVLGASPPVSVAPTTLPVGVGGVGGDPQGTGVRAEHTAGGVALDVLGKARFSTAGGGVIAANADHQQVAASSVGANSVIAVTLMQNPKGTVVRWVERVPGTGFVIHVAPKSDKPIAFSYLVVEPGAA